MVPSPSFSPLSQPTPCWSWSLSIIQPVIIAYPCWSQSLSFFPSLTLLTATCSAGLEVPFDYPCAAKNTSSFLCLFHLNCRWGMLVRLKLCARGLLLSSAVTKRTLRSHKFRLGLCPSRFTAEIHSHLFSAMVGNSVEVDPTGLLADIVHVKTATQQF